MHYTLSHDFIRPVPGSAPVKPVALRTSPARGRASRRPALKFSCAPEMRPLLDCIDTQTALIVVLTVLALSGWLVAALT